MAGNRGGGEGGAGGRPFLVVDSRLSSPLLTGNSQLGYGSAPLPYRDTTTKCKLAPPGRGNLTLIYSLFQGPTKRPLFVFFFLSLGSPSFFYPKTDIFLLFFLKILYFFHLFPPPFPHCLFQSSNISINSSHVRTRVPHVISPFSLTIKRALKRCAATIETR